MQPDLPGHFFGRYKVEEWKKIYDPGYYSDLPTALLHMVSDLDEWLQARPFKPSITDPSNPVVNFDHRWSQETPGRDLELFGFADAASIATSQARPSTTTLRPHSTRPN
ncbi:MULTISPECIES: hypothetical protein [Pseudofrankia]|uniref:hypothetical protein n=1 Tax=Pseudofrankia TaxID=2994363 RepID=UPI000234CAA3|nr:MULTISPECIES: hypothetical protein [Pseudofrankia]OHV28731.1 hypothetical protein BCD49_37530 [Pseudofrankia sp. EUN1h]